MNTVLLPPDPASARYYERHETAERDFMAHAKEETGRGMSPEDWQRQVSDRLTIRKQTDAIADKLEFARKLAWRQTVYGLGKWWVHSRKLEMIPQYRRICLLPYVAAIVRASKLAALEYFIQRHRHCRFWTFTSGVRCGIDGLEKRIQYMNRKLSKLSSFLRQTYGVEFIFRSDEFGTVEFDGDGNAKNGGEIEIGPDGEPLFHVHAHVVVHSLVGRIPPAKWEAMIRAVWDFWGHNWQADGVIRDARECCKYVTKPGDILKLSPDQLGRFHEAIFRKKLCQPMGALAQEIRDRKNNPAGRKVLRRYRKKDGSGCIWKEVFDHNEQRPVSPEEREAADNLADAERFAAELKASARVDVESAEEATVTRSVCALKTGDGDNDWQTVEVLEKTGGFWAGTAIPQRDSEKDFSRVLSRLSPSVGPSGRKEPAVVVAFSRFDQAKTEAHPLVSRLWAETVQFWEEGLGAGIGPIKVHTGTPTVHGSPDEFAESDPPDPSDEVFCYENQK